MLTSLENYQKIIQNAKVRKEDAEKMLHALDYIDNIQIHLRKDINNETDMKIIELPQPLQKQLITKVKNFYEDQRDNALCDITIYGNLLSKEGV